jgi:putative DNA primase/helicase
MSHLSVVKEDGELDRFIEYSVGGAKGLGYVKNTRATWGKMVDVLTTDRRTDMMTKQYHALSSDEKQKEKMRAGFLVGGHCDDGKRVARNIQFRSFLNLDIDNLPVADFHQFQFDLNSGEGFFAHEFLWHTTRSHTPEKPKFRILVPLKKPISAEKFVAASRILASQFDATMNHVDPVSFVLAQIMYKPLTNRDGEFLAGRNTGSFLDAEKMLDAFGDWKDYSKLPCREDETLGKLVAPGTKQENPFEKKGIVGAFNRAFPIEQVIDEYLPDVYERSSEVSSNGVRYTYLKSETGQSNGVLVYPEQGLLFSHHSSDPCGNGHSYNAFDAVRLHLYGHLDGNVKTDTQPAKYPSFKEMQERFKDDDAVSKEMLQDRYDLEALVKASMSDLDEDDEPVAKVEINENGEDALGNDEEDLITDNWITKLDRGENGSLLPTLRNVVEILTKDSRVAGMVALDEFSNAIVKLRHFPAGTLGTLPGGKKVREKNVSDVKKGDAWSDRDDAKMRYFLQLPAGKTHNGYAMRPAKQDVIDGIDLAADIYRFHPVKAAFEAEKWDGKPRVKTLFIDYLGCADDEYHRTTAELVMVAMVTRIYQPGHKWDYVPILEGKQGKRKSAFINALSNGWFAEMRGDVVTDAKKTAELLEGVMIVEIPELHSFNRTESSALKAFFTAYNDKARAAFARRSSINKRQAVFWGTTNDKEYLKDKTGNRRYWPIMCLIDFIDVDRLLEEIPQIYAEALMLYKALLIDHPSGRLPLFLEEGSEAARRAEELQESRRIESDQDREAGSLELWLDEPVHADLANCKKAKDDDTFSGEAVMVLRDMTCVKEMVELLGGGDYRKSDHFRRAMSDMKGWRHSGKLVKTQKYGPQRVYLRIGSDLDSKYK